MTTSAPQDRVRPPLQISRDPSEARLNSQGKVRLGEKAQREEFDHNLTRLKYFLDGASDTLIEAVYKDVQDVIAEARSEEDLTVQQAFTAVSSLLSLGDEV